MGYMFYGCNSLSSIDLSNFNTQNVTYMESMFSGCNSLIYKILSKIYKIKNKDWGLGKNNELYLK